MQNIHFSKHADVSDTASFITNFMTSSAVSHTPQRLKSAVYQSQLILRQQCQRHIKWCVFSNLSESVSDSTNAE